MKARIPGSPNYFIDALELNNEPNPANYFQPLIFSIFDCV